MTDTLIISDDSPTSRQLGGMISGIADVSYCTVEESAKAIPSGSYDIVILDIPLSENTDLVLQLVVLAKAKSSVIVTARVDEADLVDRCFDNGAADVIIKPLHQGLARLRVAGVAKKRIAALQDTAQEVKAERNKYRALFENMNSGFTLFRVEGDDIFIENANSKMLESMPLPKDKIIGCNIRTLMPKFYALFADVIKQVGSTGESARFDKYFELINRYMSFNIYRACAGHVAMLGQDITEKRLAEKRTVELSREVNKQFKALDNKAYELAEAKKQLELFLEGSNDGAWDYDMKSQKLSVNYQYRHQLGYDDDKDAFNTADDFFNIIADDANKAKFHKFFQKVLDGSIDLINEELQVKCKDGSLKCIIVKCVVKRDEEGNPVRVAGVNTDISERKAYEEALSRKSEELQKANDTKNMFISIIAHDLRNPFNAIIGLTDILRKREPIIHDERANEITNVILQSAKTTYEMLNNLLLWCRSQQNTITFAPEVLNLHTAIDEALREVKGQAQNKHITLINLTDNGDTVLADAQMFQTIIRNITVNSVKYTNDGGLITVSAERTPEGNDIIIEDNGVGMSKETADSLMVETRHQSTLGTKGEQGSGMGLLICKEFIGRHNGTMRVESEIGKGSRFIISFPREE